MSAVMIRCWKSYYKEQWTVIVAEEDHVYHGGAKLGMDRPVDVVIAAHRGRQKSMGSHDSGGICWGYSSDA